MFSEFNDMNLTEMLNFSEDVIVIQSGSFAKKQQLSTTESLQPLVARQTSNNQAAKQIPQQARQPSITNTASASWLDSAKAEVKINNTVAGLITSRDRRVKAEKQVFDETQINLYRQNLALQQPTPLPKQLEIASEFPTDKLPHDMARLIHEIASHLQVPSEAAGAALLGSLFIAARGNFRVKIKKGYTEALTDYILVGMPSGARKSAIVGFFRKVFDEVEQELQIDFDQDTEATALKKLVLKKIKATIQTDLLKELMEDETLDHDEVASVIAEELRPIEKELSRENSRPRFLVDSPTLKKLAMAMALQDEAIGIFEAEGGIWKQRVRSNVDDILLKGFTMEPFGDETSTAGSVVMRAPCLAICSFVQMDVAEKLYAKEDLKDHGVLPRLLPTFASWKGGVKQVNTTPIADEVTNLYERKIRSLLSVTRPEGSEGERTWFQIALDPQAQRAAQDFQQEVNCRLAEGEYEDFEAFGEKLGGHAIRLAGAMHLWSNDTPQGSLISRQSMEAGIALARFFAHHAMAAFDMDRLQAIKYAKKILAWHKRERKPDFLKRIAQRRVGRCTAEQIQAGIDLLERHGYIGQYLKPDGGVLCIVNPRYNPTQFTL